MVKLSDLFLIPLTADKQLRYVVPNDTARQLPIFENYSTAFFFDACKHELELPRKFDFPDSVLDFPTEGRWLCMQNFSNIYEPSFHRVVKYNMLSVIRFESVGDRALFRLMLP